MLTRHLPAALIALLTLAAPACRRRQAETPPAAPAAPAALTVTQTLQGLELRSGAATVFRHHDGNWHVRVSYSIRNTGQTPVDVNRESFKVDEMSGAGAHSTFPEHVAINPGITITGDIAWWRAATDPQPQAVSVKYQPGDENAPVLGTQSYPLAFAPAEPAPGAAPTAPVFTLPVTTAGTGLTFVHPDGNRHVRLSVTVQNTTTAPLRIYREHFQLRLGDAVANLASQSEMTSWGDPAVIAPGASMTGTIGFYLSGDPAPNPTQVALTFGPANSPQANLTAAVAAGPSPLQ